MQEVEDVIGIPREECILASAKEGIGTREILEAIVKQIPVPEGKLHDPLRALVFDSHASIVSLNDRSSDGQIETAGRDFSARRAEG